MSFDLFKKLVDDLHEFPDKIKLMELYQDGEPLLNKNFPEMARYLWDAGVTERTKTKTNGILLTPALVERMAESRLSWVGISVIASNEEQYKQIAQRTVDYKKLVENVGRYFAVRGDTKIYVKMARVSTFTQYDIDKFYGDFEDRCDFIAIEELHGWSREDIQDYSLGMFAPKEHPIVCPWPLYQLTINWNGAVRTCCVDWSWKTTIGDAANNSVKSVWEGMQLYEFRKMHLQGRRSENTACATCSLPNLRLDNVDEHRESILERFTQQLGVTL
jgi:MoaA/NifB/PqqE/SkfB family radical SAM enzyme